jgi:predicted dehydrogenase
MRQRTNPPLSRRGFLALSGATAVTPGLWMPRRRAANDKVQIGVIGMGIRGRNLLRGEFFPNDGFHVVAVCDVDTTRREHAKAMVDERQGSKDCMVFDDHRDLLQHPDVDAVVIATPDHWHAIQVLDACLAGKDIYCEKPLTRTLHESKTLIDAVRKTGVVFQTGSQQRTEFGHKFVTACELVRNGRIGDLLTVHVGVGNPPVACDLPAEEVEPGLDWDRWLGPAKARPYNSILSPRGVHGHYPKWRDYRDFCGGPLADMGAHHFDIAHWGIGADASGPVEILPPADPSAKRGATLVYAGGVRVVHGGPNGTTFTGTDGVIHVDRGRLVSVPDKILQEELGEDALRLPRKPNQAQDWLDHIGTRTRPICDVEVGARSAAVNLLLCEVYARRVPLAWDPTAWRFVGKDAPNDILVDDGRDGFRMPKV